MSVYANEGFYALAGFATVVSAIDGSLVPIIAPSNRPLSRRLDRCDRRLDSCVRMIQNETNDS